MSESEQRVPYTKRVRNLFRGAVRKGVDLTFERKFRSLVDEVFEVGNDFDQEVIPLIGNLLETSTKNAHDIMVPRSRVVSLSKDMTLADVLDVIKETGHSRYPLRGDDPDSVIGLVYVKDLLGSLPGGNSIREFDIEALRRDVKVVPQDQGIVALLEEFRRERVHLAVVENEYAQNVGLVTMEDVFEQFFGDIQDEHDRGEEAVSLMEHDNGGATPENNGHSDVSADLSIDEFNKFFETDLSNDLNNTIGGYLATKLGHVPVMGEKTKEGDVRFEVLEATERRIVKIRVTRNGQ